MYPLGPAGALVACESRPGGDDVPESSGIWQRHDDQTAEQHQTAGQRGCRKTLTEDQDAQNAGGKWFDEAHCARGCGVHVIQPGREHPVRSGAGDDAQPRDQGDGPQVGQSRRVRGHPGKQHERTCDQGDRSGCRGIHVRVLEGELLGEDRVQAVAGAGHTAEQ